MSGFRANSIVNRDGTGAPNFPNGIVATGATFTQVSSVNGTFSGNLTIGGTVSYQEVENIDAVGIVTAQQGIQVEANGLTVTGVGTFNNPIKVVGVTTADANGLNVAGVITATTLKGSGANLTGIIPTLSGIASGAIANGDALIIQSNGTVKKPTQTPNVSLVAPTDGTEIKSYCANPCVGYDIVNEKSLIVYNDEIDSQTLKGKIATIDNTQAANSQITFGSEFTISTNARTPLSGNKAVIYCETAGLFLVIYEGDDADIECRTVDISNSSSPSIGNEQQINNTGTEIAAVYDPNTDRVVVTYLGNRSGGLYDKIARVIHVAAGSNPTLGAETIVDSDAMDYLSYGSGWNILVYDSSAQKVVNLYHKNNNASILKGTAKVATIDTSNNTISFGSASDFSDTGIAVHPKSAVYDPISGKILVIWKEVGDVNHFYAVGTVSGTSISFSTAQSLFSNQTSQDVHILTYDPRFEVIVFTYERYTGSSVNNRLYARTLTISGNTVTFASNESAIFSSNNDFSGGDSTYDLSQNRALVVTQRSTNNAGEAFSIKAGFFTTDLTVNNFLGFSNAAYTDGQTATIQITGSVDDAQSGLTTARKHYVQNDGTLSTTAGSPSVEAGTAISATKIIVKG